MGKRYYCNYCDNTMVDSPQIIRTHTNGIMHQNLVKQYYQPFKDPETVLEEESHKRPCLKFPKGICPFGMICKFSHYTDEQISQLKYTVHQKNQIKSMNSNQSLIDLYNKMQDKKSNEDDSTILIDESSGRVLVLPWKQFEIEGYNLPPSLQKIKIDDFEKCQITEWGS